MQQVLNNYISRLVQYLTYCWNYSRRNNPVVLIKNQFIAMLREFLTVGKKKKMAMYRVNAQKYRVQKMEQLIAQSNEHMFLQGRKVNELR